MKTTLLEQSAMFEALRRRYAQKLANDELDEETENSVYIYLNAIYSLISAINDVGDESGEASAMLNKLLDKVREKIKIEAN